MDSKSNYRPPTLTVDLVAFRIHDHRLEVLLLKRGHEPFKGEWALPGGYNFAGETTVEALARIVETKIGFDISEKLGYFEQLYTVDTVARDPRGHAVSVVYMGCGHDFDIDGGTEQHRFWPVDDLPDIAFDHKEIIVNARERLASKLSYSNAVMGLLAEKFTLTHVQVAYEAVLNRQVDKRNFRKKFLSLGLIEETDELWTEGAHRPARLYRFSSRNYEILPSQF
ncbi:NUDIX domain-containing protein [Corynebacterium felinum]|uniref:8-oxo-dGTP diphosphatase n=1 Tax=Corynebacterium felinum TaxID=131318 RepID=A0ABU2B7Z4_9CORY|nr:NUDIX domain-containing protein [Corynebacterium felinum]MDF5820994.1 NUDIX domain-containing protein [Corynebacterium felinum]MDR7354740.1 8-oxo-dGTP diphosphatase [Corynebacterium felinum]WJY94103.1 bifunctional nicotinamide mononucleotide adenylyltransferase/ADP-ribose pyrophosphatase [Corynebacterium felinum]